MADFLKYFLKCTLCPRKCSINRLEGKPGYCEVGAEFLVSHYGPHFGEEPPLSGTNGAGNIFFSSCNLSCLYCQNYQISQNKDGKPMTVEKFVEVLFSLERKGCHTIGLVSPTPYIPLIGEALADAKRQGLRTPLIYNTNAYESVDALKLLEGLVDIYLPDFKYWNGRIAERLSGAPPGKSYPFYAKRAILEMHRQVGPLQIEDGIAKKGLLIRHMVLPGGLAGSREVLRWIKDTLGKETWVSLLSQYFPVHRAKEHGVLSQRLKEGEYKRIVDYAQQEGLVNVFIQNLQSAPFYIPDFESEEPFHTRSGPC